MSRDARSYFTDLAATYDDHRPGYAVDAIRAVLAGLPAPVRAADVGCGTGISTRLLARLGADVIGIDPNADMLATARRHPESRRAGIRYEQAPAEALPLSDAAVDVVACAQSFHWLDAPIALREFRRVLIPGGRLALLWNVRDLTDPFSSAYEAITRRAQVDASARGMVVRRNRSHRLDASSGFGNVRTLAFDNPHRLDRPGLLGRLRSASYFPRRGPLKQTLEADLDRLFNAHQDGGRVVIAQRTEVTLAESD